MTRTLDDLRLRQPDAYRIERAVGMLGYLNSAAVFSKDGQYRYLLERHWSEDLDKPLALWLMLNPSTAGADVDDPTIRRVVGFSKTYGCRGVRVLNLYALIATQPKRLWEHPDPVGPENDSLLAADLFGATTIPSLTIVAWGTNAVQERVEWFNEHSYGQHCLGFNADGSPKHPLYMSSVTSLKPWPHREPEPAAAQ